MLATCVIVVVVVLSVRYRSIGLVSVTWRGASWYAYYLIAKNITLYSSAKYIPQLKNLLQKKGRQQQLSGLSLYQQQTKQLASMHQ